jgi:hypothetical protein
MPIGSPVVNPLPEPGVTISYGDDLNLVLQEIIDSIEGQVPASGININSDLDFQEFTATELGACRFNNQSSALVGGSDTRKTYTVGGELFFTDGAGNPVQLTSGGTLNAAALSGISGAGYGTAGVAINWDAVGTEYEFKLDASADGFADVQLDTVRFNDGSGNYTALDGASGLSGNITFTLPSALPGAAAILQSSPSGVISASNTIVGANVSCAGLAITDGAIKHGNVTYVVPGASFNMDITSFTAVAGTGRASGTGKFNGGLVHKVGDRIRTVVVTMNKLSGTWTISLRRTDGVTPVVVASTTQASLGQTSATLSAIDHVVLSSQAYYIECSNALSTESLNYAEITFDHP